MKKRLYSIRKLQRIMILLFILPILALQIIQNFFSLQALHTEMESNGRSTIYLYQSGLDNDVERIATFISNYWAQEYNHNRLLYPQTPLDAYGYSYNVLNEYRTLINIEPSISSIFLISGQNDMIKGACSTEHTTYEERAAMRAYVYELTDHWGENAPYTWHPVKLENRYFLVREFLVKNAGTVCFLDLEQTLIPQNTARFPEDPILFYADSQGTPLTSRQFLKEKNIRLSVNDTPSYFSAGYFIVQNYSPVSDMYMVFLESSPISFQKMNRLFWAILGLSLLVLALVPLFFLSLKRWYLQPMKQMDQTLQKIHSGQMDVRFAEDQKTEELKQLSTSFNSMMDQVQNLKIEAYEKELSYQYAQLQYLQLQISPHFFLNILKTLYGMAEKRNYEKIQNAILMISDHVRYIFHDNKDRVPLTTELSHVENYINMQRYITSRLIHFSLLTEPGLENALIPALCLQTFVENACKYAMLPDRPLELSLEIRRLYSEEGDSLDITVKDNGPGLSEELLKEYNGKVSFGYRENHIGILNVRQRLYLLYGERFGFACWNLHPGTEFELIFPITEKEEPEEKEEENT